MQNYNILDSYQTNDTNIRCRIIERLDKNCICHNYNNYFVNGIEYMNLSFDYRYLTTFEKGGNIQDLSGISVITEFYDINKQLFKIFNKNENIRMSIKDYLNLTKIDLDTYNYGTKPSIIDYTLVNTSSFLSLELLDRCL